MTAEDISSATEAPANAELVIDLSTPVATLEKEAEEINEVLPEHEKGYYDDYIRNFEPCNKKKLFYRFIKRAFDMVASLIALILLSPVMLACVIAIKCNSKGPAVFCQQRVGRNGKPFKFYKFRSMYITAPKECATSLLNHPEQHITKVGAFLRKTSLDELPQLWCVFVGSMSFIGYRPLVLTEKKCNDMRRSLNVFSMRPGISGYAQVHGRDDVHYKDKAILDAEYVKNASAWLDIKIFFQTALIVFRADGNDQKKIDERETENAL